MILSSEENSGIAKYQGQLSCVFHDYDVTADQLMASLSKIPNNSYIDNLMIDKGQGRKSVIVKTDYSRTYEYDYPHAAPPAGDIDVGEG